MIGFISGKVLYTDKTSAVVLANGVGWQVNVGFGVATEGQDIELHIATVVRENDISLWGFANRDELKLFRLLTGVSGVGPKTAQTLLSVKGLEEIQNAVELKDVALIKVPGVGAKTAQKIIIELSGKMDASNFSASFVPKQTSSEMSDAKDALEALGYKEREINKAFEKLKNTEGKNTNEIIKLALQNL